VSAQPTGLVQACWNPCWVAARSWVVEITSTRPEVVASQQFVSWENDCKLKFSGARIWLFSISGYVVFSDVDHHVRGPIILPFARGNAASALP
jgi:hypothetical protein